MELHELAERIVFATTLEAKLGCPTEITDSNPGAAWVAPEAPGRPRELEFKRQDSPKVEVPGVHHLDRERERGRLLHFFANHELLATELMALVLLRFPKAPSAFRKGVLQTLMDEQRHTRLYLQRMRECGVQFGDLPVSGYFWRSVSTMESPLDFVSSLSLTFEQANLDYCLHFAMGFQTVGDARTAKLLEGIYRDEIGHVAHGLKWFRRWKNPTETDWDAFCRQLKYPLSPSRAKGVDFNVQGRRDAGLEPSFIDQLTVHVQSRGRTPSVFWFNPFSERVIAQGQRFTPTQHQRALMRDLSALPQFLARQDDVVLVASRPSVRFLSGLRQAGFALPEFVEVGVNGIAPPHPIRSRKLGRLRPWAWAPDSLEMMGPLFAQVSGEPRGPGEVFNPTLVNLVSKVWSASFLTRVLQECSDIPGLCGEEMVGAAVESIESAKAAVERIRRTGHHRVVVKETFGLAGGNMVRLWEPEVLQKQWQWMEKALGRGQSLVVEPWLERWSDFSIQCEMGRDGLKRLGYAGLVTLPSGQFCSNWVEPEFRKRIPLRPAPTEGPAGRPWGARHHWQAGVDRMLALLEPRLRTARYEGPLGIDAFVYRTGVSEFRLKPVVEINFRYTMGRLALELMDRVAPGGYGAFRLMRREQVKAAGFIDFQSYADHLLRQRPIRSKDFAGSKILDGAIVLNDPVQASAVLAVFEVGPSQAAVLGG